MLKSIEISGFKSFGNKAKLDFKTPISAIVGPNGSGKSNVAEAFRFALGEQSMKSLRGKKTEDLIFNGSVGGNRSNRASVKVVLNNSKKPLKIDFDEVVLERVVHRDATHEYKINDSKVRRKDIVELLANANIGSTGHHIISQGQADRILNVSPEERREMIEDALGLRIYHYKKKESLRKLHRTEQNLKEIEGLRREIHPHLKFLKKQVNKIEKAKEERDRLISLYQDYFSYESNYLNEKTNEIESLFVLPKNQLKEIDSEIKRLREVLDSVKTESELSENLSALNKDLRSIQNNRNSLTRELGRVEGELDMAEKMLRKTTSISSRNVSLDEVQKLTKEIIKDNENILGVENISSIKELIKKVNEKILIFLSTHKEEEIESVDDLGLLREKKITIEKEIASIDEKKTKLLEEQSELQKKSEEERKAFYVAERDLFKILAKQNEIRAKLDKLEDQDFSLQQRKILFEKEIRSAGMMLGREAVNYDDKKIEGDESEQKTRLKDIERLKIKLEDSGIGSYGELKKEYDEVLDRDAFFEKEILDLSNTKSVLEGMIKEIEATLNIRFKDGLNQINTQFQEFFSSMFGGGSASLLIVRKGKGNDEEDEEVKKDGIDISVDLPKKRIRGLQMLSGGERALTSIALLFALSQINPPPFIILDETDAALDEANSKRYGDMIENLAKYSQLILITHNRETMSRAGLLYGVTMREDGISRLLSIEFDEALMVAK